MDKPDNDMPDKKESVIREQPMTYEDYANLPDDGNRYELVNGMLELLAPGPSVKHQFICAEIYHRLRFSCSDEYFLLTAPIDLILSKVEVRQPDLVMIHRNRVNILTSRGIEGPPDLVVEILSPSTIKRDKVDKLKTYAAYKVPEYWIVDPKNGTLEQYRITQERYELVEVYQGDEVVRSEHISCASFSMNQILSQIPGHLKD